MSVCERVRVKEIVWELAGLFFQPFLQKNERERARMVSKQVLKGRSNNVLGTDTSPLTPLTIKQV